MSEKARKMAAIQKAAKRPKRVRPASALSQFNCKRISYSFKIPLADFDADKFSKNTKIDVTHRWSAGIYPKDPQAGYHVDFNGDPGSGSLALEVEYWDEYYRVPADDKGPFAESIMQWVAAFVKGETPLSAVVLAVFQKPITIWRSRINLPYKVNVADAEVLVDGISVVFPPNKYHVSGCFLMLDAESISANIQGSRLVHPAGFSIDTEVVHFNESLDMILERA
jgi:hypothetical protein